MIAYCPLDEVEPPMKKQKAVEKVQPEEVKPQIGREETELNYVVMAFIVGVVLLAVSDSIRA
jgi:hypothetical protein